MEKRPTDESRFAEIFAPYSWLHVDIVSLRQEMGTLRQEVKQEISELRKEIAGLRQKIK